MEQIPNFEQAEDREAVIDRLIETLAKKEGMSLDDLSSDIVTFAELSQEDENAKAYFEELAEKISVSFEEVFEYAIKKAKENI